MTTKAKPSFIRLFVGGFVVGAAALVAVQAAQADGTPPAPTAPSSSFIALAR